MAHLEPSRVTVGVDTHKHLHVAAARDQLGRRLGITLAPATSTGYGQLLAWARGLGEVQAWGVEGTGSYGAGLARFLTLMASGSWRSTAPTERPAGGSARATRWMLTPPPGPSRRGRRPASPRPRTARWR
jgi:transposase